MTPSILPLLLGLALAPIPAEEVTDAGLSLDLVLETRDDRGHVYCALWPSAEGFPTQRSRIVYEGRATRIRERRARIRFMVHPGAYAAACFHDANQNRRLDTNFLGIPSEGTGASNDARGFMGPPGFDDARFTLTSTRTLTIHLQYL